MESLGDRFANNYTYLPADGTRGGILLAVDEACYSLSSIEIGQHSITAKITTESGLLDWTITVVYGPQGDNENYSF